MEIRKDATEWRSEMKRQFDGFRAASSEQLAAEERRYGELFKRSQDRQVELQTALDIARQMCAELPSTKARVLHLEQMLESAFARGLETHQASARVSAPAPAGERREPQAPEDEGHDLIMPEPSLLTMPVMDEARMAELEERLKATQEQNASLQQALTASRLRSRLKNRPHSTVQSLH